MKTKTIAPPKPQFDKLTFESEQRFEEWLKRAHTKKIEFVDSGLDMDTMWVHNSGEVLHVNMQASVWNGKFIDMDRLAVGMPVRIYMHGKWREIDVVEKITDNKYEAKPNP